MHVYLCTLITTQHTTRNSAVFWVEARREGFAPKLETLRYRRSRKPSKEVNPLIIIFMESRNNHILWSRHPGEDCQRSVLRKSPWAEQVRRRKSSLNINYGLFEHNFVFLFVHDLPSSCAIERIFQTEIVNIFLCMRTFQGLPHFQLIFSS